MPIPKPKIESWYHQAAWAYLTVEAKRAHGQEMEFKQPGGSWEPATAQGGSQWLMPMQQVGKTEWRARYTRGDDRGPWATGRVWMPDGFEADDDSGNKPEPPYGLQASKIGGTFATIDWAPPTVLPDAWKFSWRRAGQKHWSSRSVNSGQVEIIGGRRQYKLTDLFVYSDYAIQVRAVLDGVDSDPADLAIVTTARLDDLPGPADPVNATADTVTDTTATISWDQDDPRAVKHWQVAVAGHGPTETTGEQEHTFNGLKPGTAYTANVWAVGHDGSYAKGFAEVQFTTDSTTPVGPQPPTGLRVINTDPVSGRATVGWNSAVDAEFWRILLEDVDPQPRRATSNQFVFRGLEAGRTYRWQVRAVATDEDGYEQESAWVRGPEFQLEDTPDPKPDPPTGLEVHCISDVKATVTWDQNANVDGWFVWLDTRTPSGTLETYTPGVKLTDLKPDTVYTVYVAAFTGSQESDAATFTFSTLATVDPPTPPPPPDIGADLPAVKGLMVRALSTTEIEAWWTDERPEPGSDNQYFLASVDGRLWERLTEPRVVFEDLLPGVHTVHVYAVIDGKKLTGIARAAATTKAGA